MPDPQTKKRAAKDKREGKSPSTQAGDFMREEIHHVREGKHGARNTEQAIAIGLSNARRSTASLAGQAKQAASRRGARVRSLAAQKAVRTKGEAGRSRAAKKAAATRAHSA